MNKKDLKNLVESLIFSADEPLAKNDINKILSQYGTFDLDKVLNELIDDYKDRGVVLYSSDNKFYFMDKVNYEDIPAYLIKGHLLLLTSFYEGFGRVVLEAMTFGVPCVSTKSGGPEDIIKKGLNGFIVNKRDPIELAKKCCLILKNKSKYKKMSDYAHLNAVKNYSFEKLSNNFIDILLDKSK